MPPWGRYWWLGHARWGDLRGWKDDEVVGDEVVGDEVVGDEVVGDEVEVVEVEVLEVEFELFRHGGRRGDGETG
jgi:hypothetical protein